VDSGYTTVNTLIGGLGVPAGLAVDASGNVYFANFNSFGSVYEILAIGGYATVETVANLFYPFGVALDAGGNIYVGTYGAGTITELPRSQPPPFAFGPTNVGAASSPQSTTILTSTLPPSPSPNKKQRHEVANCRVPGGRSPPNRDAQPPINRMTASLCVLCGEFQTVPQANRHDRLDWGRNSQRRSLPRKKLRSELPGHSRLVPQTHRQPRDN
jgi:hypothetical protein